jgi:hypothetical protein
LFNKLDRIHRIQSVYTGLGTRMLSVTREGINDNCPGAKFSPIYSPNLTRVLLRPLL